MKWLFFILLLINIGLLLWIYPQNIEQESVTLQSTGAEGLLLLSEVEGEALATLKKMATVVDVTGQADPEGDAESTIDEQPVAQGTFPEPSIDQEQLSVEGFPIPNDVEESKQEAAPSITNNNSLDTAVDMAESPGQKPESLLRVECRRIGPLGKRTQADELSLRLRASGLQPELYSEVSNNQEGYWVLVPPQKNRTVAVRIVERLQEAGITDLWRFTSGSLAHAISLGLFRDEARAEIRRKSIAVKGFDVEVRPRYRQKTSYWLSFSYSGESPLTEDRWKELLTRYPEAEKLTVDCQEIATQ